ncbi:MAG TPA: hypothetical protein VGE50_05720, partial [Gammaproteobacteria bacterium]
MQGTLSSFIVRILFLTLFLSLTAHATTEIDNDYAGALWVAKSDGILKLATANGHVLFEISDASDAQAMAIDERRGRLWLYGNGLLSAYAFDGKLITSHRDLSSQGQSSLATLTVSPTDGSVWLGSGNRVVHYSSDATILGTSKNSGIITAITAAQKSSAVWVADAQSISLVNEANNQITLRELYKSSSPLLEMHYVDYLQQLWVVTSTSLVRLDNAGKVQSETPFQQLKHIAPDHKGAVWAVAGQKVYRMDASGLIEAELNLFLPREGGDIVALVADKADGTAWLANRKTIVHLGLAGQTLNEIQEGKGSAGINALALFRDLIAPLISILNPVDNSITPNNHPLIEISYSDTGIGVDGETLLLFVNAQDVTAQCETTEEG